MFFFLHFETFKKSPVSSFVSQNVATMFCSEAPEILEFLMSCLTDGYKTNADIHFLMKTPLIVR